VLGKSWYCNRKINWKKNGKKFKTFLCFYFRLFFFVFFLSQTCDGCERWRAFLKKAFVRFFMKLNALLSEMTNLSQNLDVLNIEDL
jgi:hypothetical protein